MLMKCKPTYQFQSIEFDFSIQSTNDLPKMFDMYNRVLKGLMEIAPVQEKQAQPKEPLATENQKKTMDRFGIAYNANTTRKEAQELIQASIDG